MNDSDIFHQLQFGTRFSKKHEELKSKEKKKESRVEESEPASTDFTLPPQLDFFGTQKRKNKATETTQTNPPTKKRKISHIDDPSDPSDHSDHSDEEKNAEIPSCLVAPKATDHKSYQKLRKQHRIQVDQANLPLLTSFDELTTRYNAKQYIVKNITEELSFSTPTPIQMQAIPALVEGNEVVACAPTGSGKTAAFAIPMLMALKNPSKGNHRALILSPTRELAMQTYQQVKRLSKDKAFRICLLTKATTPMETESNTRRFDIIVSTPLRLVRLIQDNSIKLDTIEYLVMDEADQLFELGFLSQIDEIIAACSNKTVLRCLFSATMPPSVEQMAKSFLRNPVRIVIGAKNSAASTLQQRLVYCGQEEGKILALRQLIEEGIDPPVIIFVQSKDRAMELYHELIYDNINADVITSDRTKAQRDKTVKQFRTGNIWVLIATDLMARGMDFRGVNLVVNYDIPPTATQYIHRIGRAGRAGRAGKAVSFYTKDDLTILRSIVSVMRASGMAMPDWMSLLPKPSKKDKRTTPQRDSISNAPSKNKRRKKKKRSKSKKNQDQQDTTEPAEETSN